MQKINCKFCHLDKSKNKVILETNYFVFFESFDPIIKGHYLLASKFHILLETEIRANKLRDYKKANIKAYKYIKKTYKYLPLVFINPPQQQSVPHFHRHFLPGVFGVSGVAKALKTYFEKYGKQYNS